MACSAPHRSRIVTTTPTTITVPFHRVQRGHGKAFTSKPRAEPIRRPARVAIMLALSHYIRSAIQSGRVPSQVDAANRLGCTPARMSQLLCLLQLAPDLQERVLLLEAVDGVQPLPERMLRPIVHLVSWADQRAAFDHLGVGGSPPGSASHGHTPAAM